MSMATKYAMMKRSKMGAPVCAACKGGMCMEHGGEMMADGGEIGVHHAASGDAGYEGRSVAGRSAANKTKHGNADAKKEHVRVLKELKSMKKPHLYAEGGDVDDVIVVEPSSMVDRIMRKRYSEGGEVANDVGDGEEADKLENQFDDLVLRDDLEADYTGANSGDEIGDAEQDHERADIVSKIMRSRAKKGHMPRPA